MNKITKPTHIVEWTSNNIPLSQHIFGMKDLFDVIRSLLKDNVKEITFYIVEK